MKNYSVATKGFKDPLFLCGFYASQRNYLERFKINKNGITDPETQKIILKTFQDFKQRHAKTTIENVELFFHVNLVFVSKFLKHEELNFELRFKRIPSEWNNPCVFRQYKGESNID